MIVRYAHDNDVVIHLNNKKGMSKKVKLADGTFITLTYPDGTKETLTYPSSYTYFVDVDGEIVKKSNSFKVIEEFYVSECAKKHSDGHGRLIIGKHKLVNGIATNLT